ncbi:hypothetical protein ACOY5P_17530 [Enterobacter asburiae]|uniref:hypothetical protein n=1 Tax=Enterobacterales TaxID=91347 RepID=UPI001EF8B120|nr:hypothetical protein [Serratia marcescens]
MKKLTGTFIVVAALFSASGMAAEKTTKGAVAGAVIGAATGKSLKSTASGAVVGAGGVVGKATH